MVMAYKEAGASEYILDTFRLGYKLGFIDNKPPPSNFRELINLPLASLLFFMKSFYVWKVWVVQSGLILGPILSILVVLCTLKNGGVLDASLFLNSFVKNVNLGWQNYRAFLLFLGRVTI
jgi:hypothetical protein